MKYIIFMLVITTLYPLNLLKWGLTNIDLITNPQEVLLQRLLSRLDSFKAPVYQYPYKKYPKVEYLTPLCSKESIAWLVKGRKVSSPTLLHHYWECEGARLDVDYHTLPGYQHYENRKLALTIHIARVEEANEIRAILKAIEKKRYYKWVNWEIDNTCITEYLTPPKPSYNPNTCSRGIRYLKGINSTPTERAYTNSLPFKSDLHRLHYLYGTKIGGPL